MVDAKRNIPTNHRLAERVLIRCVHSGEWTIDEIGRIWTHISRQHFPIPRRAEQWVPTGYLMVRRMFHGVRHVGLAHRLVWQYVYGDIPEGMVINHCNGQKDCNIPSNLEVVTYSENIKHAYALGLKDEHGERNPAAKLSNAVIKEIRVAYAAGNITMDELGTQYGVQFQHISRLVRGERRQAQPGPTTRYDHRHSMSERDPATGRFLPKGNA